MAVQRFKSAGRVFCLAAFLVGLLLQTTGATARDERRITATFRHEPLEDVLATISELAGWSIDVIGAPDDWVVSEQLRKVSIEESLERILYPRNYTLIWSSGNVLTIHLMADRGARASAAGDVSFQADEGLFDDPVSLFPGPDEVIPPSYPGGQGLTAQDIEYYRTLQIPSDPMHEEVVPPSAPGTVGITRAEIEFYASTRQVEGPADMELFPPEEGDGFVFTAADLRELRANRPLVPAAQIEVIPPEEQGGIGVTLGELQALRQSTVSQPPLTMEDVIPPE
jgi:hypothetical protein